MKTRNAVLCITQPRPVVVSAVTELQFMSKRKVRAHSCWYLGIGLGRAICNRIVSSIDSGGDGCSSVVGSIKMITQFN